MNPKRESGARRVCAAAAMALLAALAASGAARAQDALAEALASIEPSALAPGADAFGPVAGTPPAAPLLSRGETIGYAFLSADTAKAIGYSGKPVEILIGMDADGTVLGARLWRHSEPIVLTGISETRMAAFIDRYTGRRAAELMRADGESGRSPDMISGATVTAMVIDDAISRSVAAMARALGGAGPGGAAGSRPQGRIDPAVAEPADWLTLLGEGAVARLALTVGEVGADFARAGKPEAAENSESANPGDTFIDLYAAVASVPAIGRSLLGEAEYARLAGRLEAGRHAILIAGNGLFSFKGSGYVRGGVFDRIRLTQGAESVRFRDRDHKRLGGVEAPYAQDFAEVGLFLLPAGAAFDPTAPWRLELLASRAVGALEKAFLTYDLHYALPERYILRDAPPPAAAAARAEAPPPLWRRAWRDRGVDIAVLAAALAALTGVFFFQDRFARRPRLAAATRFGFLLFTVVWIGGYAQAQLSAVNMLAFANALAGGGFAWAPFMIDPLIFMLWAAVAISVLFWGRGPFCGWLCPFGALQELLNKGARLLRAPQITLPWGLHERLRAVKYILFVGLLGASLHSLAFAGTLAEVEPFKTAVALRFVREWPFLLYAGLLLAAGLFVERFFCRYLCPLGAALAIPGRLRIFDWLRRHPDCGSPCQRCGEECMVQAIRPDGAIDPNECLYCLHCQLLYRDERKCPAMIRRRLKRERRRKLASPAPYPAPRMTRTKGERT